MKGTIRVGIKPRNKRPAFLEKLKLKRQIRSPNTTEFTDYLREKLENSNAEDQTDQK
jgi:hypothetical protein